MSNNGRFNNKPSEVYSAAIKALQELTELESIDMASNAFAEVSYQIYERQFAEKNGYRRRSGLHVCFHRLYRRTCPDSRNHPCNSPQAIPGADHISEWVKDGQTVAIVSQPYGFTYREMKEAVLFCEKYGLEVEIDTWPSFHFPGHVLTVIYTKKVK